jgi:hypothetical protein
MASDPPRLAAGSVQWLVVRQRPGSTPLIDAATAALAGAEPGGGRAVLLAGDNVVNGAPTPVLDPAKVGRQGGAVQARHPTPWSTRARP